VVGGRNVKWKGYQGKEQEGDGGGGNGWEGNAYFIGIEGPVRQYAGEPCMN